MEHGSIEREVHIDATPEVVFEVISSPEHLREWWPDEAVVEPTAGSSGEVIFGNRASADAVIVPITVVDAVPPRLFSFRWTHAAGQVAADGNSLLVTFELAASGAGTALRMTEVGFREMGWEIAVLEETYNDHVEGWDYHLARLAPYVARLASTR